MVFNAWDDQMMPRHPGGPDFRFRISNSIHEIVDEWACDDYYLCSFRPENKSIIPLSYDLE